MPTKRSASQRDASVPPGTRLWHMWPGRNWPATASEEQSFVADLRERCSSPSNRFDRGDVTAVLNALRCGLVASELLARAPGLRPECLYGAWSHVETLRHRSARSWELIASAGDVATFAEHAGDARRLLPIVIARLSAAAPHVSDEAFARLVSREATLVSDTTVRADEIESQLVAYRAPSPDGIRLGSRLYDPYRPALWGESHFLARRVGELVPVRVADLLGERD